MTPEELQKRLENENDPVKKVALIKKYSNALTGMTSPSGAVAQKVTQRTHPQQFADSKMIGLYAGLFDDEHLVAGTFQKGKPKATERFKVHLTLEYGPKWIKDGLRVIMSGVGKRGTFDELWQLIRWMADRKGVFDPSEKAMKEKKSSQNGTGTQPRNNNTNNQNSNNNRGNKSNNGGNKNNQRDTKRSGNRNRNRNRGWRGPER